MKIEVFVFVVCIALLPGNGLLAQRQITARVIDSETKKPVKEAKVSITGTDVSTITNVLGFFELSIDSIDNLTIECKHYETGRISVPDVNNFQITLKKVPEIFMIIEETATFPGGMAAFYSYINRNLKFPKDARKSGVSGKVYVEFVIDSTGAIPPEQIEVKQGLFKSCDEEAIRLIKESPKWNPPRQRGRPVRQKMVLPIVFK